METFRITASEFQKAFGAMSDAALRRPVTITKQGRDHLVVLAAEEYEKLRRGERRAFAAGELPEEWVEQLKADHASTRVQRTE